jgi:biopolymer transport protein ExbD
MATTQDIGETSDNPVAINVIALVDVIFCLCLFFMCSFHFKQVEGALSAWLPKDRGNFDGSPRSLSEDEICIVIHWDARRGKSIRGVRNRPPVESDGALLEPILSIVDGYEKTQNNSWHLSIDAAPDVPWQDVLHVMDLCKLNRIERIELAPPRSGVE